MNHSRAVIVTTARTSAAAAALRRSPAVPSLLARPLGSVTTTAARPARADRSSASSDPNRRVRVPPPLPPSPPSPGRRAAFLRSFFRQCAVLDPVTTARRGSARAFATTAASARAPRGVEGGSSASSGGVEDRPEEGGSLTLEAALNARLLTKKKKRSEAKRPSPATPPRETVRLSKRMSELDLCSRREADALIVQPGRVWVDGEPIRPILGQRVPFDANDIRIVQSPDNGGEDLAKFDWEATKFGTVVLNKPPGYVCSKPEANADRVPAARLLTESNYFPLDDDEDDAEKRFWDAFRSLGRPAGAEDWQRTLSGYAPAGRLDLKSRGVMLFTRSGVLAKKIIGSDSYVTKEYVVKLVPASNVTRVERGLGLTKLPRANWDLGTLLRGGKVLAGEDRALKPLVEAEWLEGGWTGEPFRRDHGIRYFRRARPAPPSVGKGGTLRLVLREGKKHQVRRMCREVLGMHVVGLERTGVGPVTSRGLPEGKWRFLEEDEVKHILEVGKEEDCYTENEKIGNQQ